MRKGRNFDLWRKCLKSTMSMKNTRERQQPVVVTLRAQEGRTRAALAFGRDTDGCTVRNLASIPVLSPIFLFRNPFIPRTPCPKLWDWPVHTDREQALLLGKHVG